MRAVILRSLLVIGGGGLVLAVVLYVASTVDARAPEVLSISVTQPVGGDPGLALITTSIEVAFSEPVEPDSAAALRIEPEVTGAASWSGSTLIYTPDEALALDTDYTVSVTGGVEDLAGNGMAELPPSFTFRTAGRPSVVDTDPVHGAVDVAVDHPIQVRFSTLMDTASVEDALELRPAFAHELRWSEEVLEIVPTDPLRPDRDYEVLIAATAADAAGVALGGAVTLGFRTVAPGLAVETVVPADGVDGIALATSIAVIFDRPIDPASLDDDAFAITPDVAGTLAVVAAPGEEGDGAPSGRILTFTPSGSLPPTTTFDVELAPGVAGVDGGGLAEPLRWSFTTGAPPAVISNQVTFLSDRSGVANLWAMNPDGTGQRQLSAELIPILDYAVAPDGSSMIVADGRRLVYLRADGSDRRVLTGEDHREIDPTYAPTGDRVAFARVDAASGTGLGLWEWQVEGGDASPIEQPQDVRDLASPVPDGADASVLRAPRYAPDGLALAFVDTSGAVGLLELPAQRLTRIAFSATAPPAWLPDSATLLLTGVPGGDGAAGPIDVPIPPLAPDGGSAVYRLARSGTEPAETRLGPGWRLLAVALDGTIAYATDEGWLGTAASVDAVRLPSLIRDATVLDAAFAPGEAAMVVVLGETPDDRFGRVERIDLETGRRTTLAPDGSRPRWLP
jgi:hypothetical protein